jgi:hypothetical protein
MSILRNCNWEFLTSAGGSGGGGGEVIVGQAGGGLIRLRNTNTNQDFQINFLFAGLGIGAGLKGKAGSITEAVAKFLNRIKGASGAGSLPATPSAGLIFATSFAPAGDLPLNTFTGFFQFVSVDAVGGIGSADMTAAVFFKPGIVPVLDSIIELPADVIPGVGAMILMKDIWAVGFFSSIGFGLGLSASLTRNVAIVTGASLI